jgi:hypothetical protein
VVSLTGGAPDRTPPKVLSSVPEQNTTNFKDKIIVLQFDEYIQMLDAANELMISPRLKELPELVVKGKKLFVDFTGKSLQPNTTYHLSFGKSIADMNERNILEGYEFTFSTGAHIDSLSLSGEILQAEDNMPAADQMVGLYAIKDASDSLPYKTEPLYICKGSASGKFQFSHLPADNYLVFAIGDKNKNYVYDGDQERIAFYSDTLKLQHDSTIALKAFKEAPSRTFITKSFSPNYGRALVILNKPTSIKIKALQKENISNLQIESSKAEEDTVVMYYKNVRDTLALVAELPNSTGADTLFIKLPTVKKRSVQNPDLIVTSTVPSKTDCAILKFNTWMDTSSASTQKMKWYVKKDSNAVVSKVLGHWLNTREYQIHQSLQPGTQYSIALESGAFSDLNHNSQDSIVLSFKTKSTADFGKLTLKILFKIKQQYQIELINESGKVIAQRSVFFSLSSSNVASLEFSDIQPGIYKVRIIYDTNANGKWDGGNLLKRVQPEKISMLSKQIKVISDWELEENLEEK